MKLKLTLQRSGGPAADLSVTADAITTVGDLARYLAQSDPAASVHRVEPEQLTLGLTEPEPRSLDPRAALADSGLQSGATVSISQAGSTYRDPQGETAAMITVVAGPDAGREFPLHTGTNIVGRERGCEVRLGDQLVSRQHARITVTDTIEVVDLGSSNGLQVGEAVVPRTTLRPGETVLIGESLLTGRMLTAGRTVSGGSVSFVRSPRLDPIYAGAEYKAPAPPEYVRSQRFPMLSVLAALLMGGVLFLATRSLYSLAFVGITPILLVATSAESRLEARAAFREGLKQFRADLTDLVEELRQAAEREVWGRNHEHPPVGECVEAVRRGGPLLWTRRPGEHGFAEFRLGLGRQPARNTVKEADANRAPRFVLRELAETLAPWATVEPVPIVARPGEHGAIGLAGPREPVLAAARAVLIQAATLHSPAELVIAGLASVRSAADWDWLKWLPHTSAGSTPLGHRLATTAPTAGTLLGELETLLAARIDAARDPSRAAPSLPAVLLLVEQDAPAEHSRLVELAEVGGRHGIHVLWLAGDLAQLPAACRTFVDIGEQVGDAAAGFVHSSERVLPLQVELTDATTAIEVARRLAPLVDIGARLDDDSDLPRSVNLLTLVGPELATAPEAVIERWSENSSVLTGPFAPPGGVTRAGSLRAVIGQSAADTHAVDLRVDGPHALVGGTTGSGKSELLQAWILAMALAHSPQRLAFLLVDYKGGSAFRDCVDLPHTVGLVTDLSPHLVRRALTSLGAELRHREHLLARHNAKDLVSLERQGVLDAPPSLVIVVDEFAALVSEVPEFVDGMVDVAQRGRSLGLHLILATQRPAGVIRENLRANTNLRMGLRVADIDDSLDVLGAPDAAFFDQAIPGRAMSKTGPGRLVPFQTGYAGGHTADTPPEPELVVEELVFGTGRRWEGREPTGILAETGPSDIRRLVATIGSAGQLAEIPMPRKPWLPELRASYDLADQSLVPTRRRDTELIFGVRDDPDAQEQPSVAFQPDRDGNLAVYGTGGAGKSTLLRTLAVAAGFTVRGGPCHVYGIDFGARGLAMLEELPHVGSIVAGSDHERISRLIGWLRELIDERAARYSRVDAGTITDYRRVAEAPDEPRILLMVDGLMAFRSAYETVDRVRWFEMFSSIATDGRPVGVHVVLSTEQRAGMPPGLAAAIQRRLVLRLAVPDDYSMLDVPLDVLGPESPPGRGVFGDHETQVAVLGGSPDVAAQAAAVRAFAESMRRAGAIPAPPIERLAEQIGLDELPPTLDGLPVIGLAATTLGPATMPVQGTFLVAGPRGSGRTTTLHTLARALRRSQPELALHYLGQRRSPLSGLDLWSQRAAGPDQVAELAEQLTAQLTVGQPAPMAVFVEDIGEFVDGPADLALQGLAKALLAEDQLLVSDGEAAAIASGYGLLGIVKSSRSGIALAPSDTDGQMLFRTNFPRLPRTELPPGRGLIVRLGRPELIQVAQP